MSTRGVLVIDDGRPVSLEATVVAEAIRVEPEALAAGLGWTLKPEGLCRDGVCVPVRDRAALVGTGGIDLAELARLQDRPFAADAAAGIVVLGTSAGERAERLRSLEAPDFTLPDVTGAPHSLSEHRGKKRLLVAWGSWCGCREDLPAWQELHAELGDRGFVPITVALDQSVAAARPFIERAAPTHPALIDTEHTVAELFNLVNVPTTIWIDADDRIVRPNDVQFGTDTFIQFTGRPSGPFLDAVRAWVRDDLGALPAERVRAHQLLPTAAQQQARAEFTLAWHLHRAGRHESAERHFRRAGELAPGDWTIRRAALPIRGIDPMASEEFLALWQEGVPGYPAPPLVGPAD